MVRNDVTKQHNMAAEMIVGWISIANDMVIKIYVLHLDIIFDFLYV